VRYQKKRKKKGGFVHLSVDLLILLRFLSPNNEEYHYEKYQCGTTVAASNSYNTWLPDFAIPQTLNCSVWYVPKGRNAMIFFFLPPTRHNVFCTEKATVKGP